MKDFVDKIAGEHNSSKCPMCGAQEWGTLPIHGKLPVGDDGSQSVPMAIKFCTNCGFTAQFLRVSKS